MGVLGGVAAGAVVGLLSSRLTSHFGDPLHEITLTTTAEYGSLLLPESIHVSTVMAMSLCGLVIGNYDRRRICLKTQPWPLTLSWNMQL